MQRHTLMNTRTKLATDDLVTMEGSTFCVGASQIRRLVNEFWEVRKLEVVSISRKKKSLDMLRIRKAAVTAQRSLVRPLSSGVPTFEFPEEWEALAKKEVRPAAPSPHPERRRQSPKRDSQHRGVGRGAVARPPSVAYLDPPVPSVAF